MEPGATRPYSCAAERSRLSETDDEHQNYHCCVGRLLGVSIFFFLEVSSFVQKRSRGFSLLKMRFHSSFFSCERLVTPVLVCLLGLRFHKYLLLLARLGEDISWGVATREERWRRRQTTVSHPVMR